MSKFDLNIIHFPAKSNIVVDALSRRSNHVPSALTPIAVGIELDLLHRIRHLQETSSDLELVEFRHRALANEYGMCMSDG